MFKIDDIVQHKKTGKIGVVIGYGYRKTQHIYFLTLKVKIFNSFINEFVIEDTVKDWLSWQKLPETLSFQNIINQPMAA